MDTQITHIPVIATSADDLSNLLVASIELEETKKELKKLKSMVKLTDFTHDELMFNIVAVTEQKDKAINSIAMHETIGTDPESDQVKFWKRQLAYCMTWEVQLRTAAMMVKEVETVNAN